jgi:spore maturation protein CgeB
MTTTSAGSRVLLVGHFASGSLERSYWSAFEALGCQVSGFDVLNVLDRYTRLGVAGRLFNQFVPVEPWVRKMGRELVVTAMRIKPALVVTFGHYPFRPGPLAQLKISTNSRLVHVWPDTLVNWHSDLTACLSLYDLIAGISYSALPAFKQLGARKTAWVPLAGDPTLHGSTPPVSSSVSADIAFIGGWRPEREEALSCLEGFDLKIWGPDWGRRCKNNRVIQTAWQGGSAWGSEFARIVVSAKINLNVIDPTNYPAANMRFFEIPMAGGFQICSHCPEMEDIFCHGEHLLYYQQKEELPDLIRMFLHDEPQRREVAVAAHEKVMAAHLYQHRAQAILNELGSISQ